MTLFRRAMPLLLVLQFSFSQLSMAGTMCEFFYLTENTHNSELMDMRARSLIPIYKAKFLIPEESKRRIRNKQMIKAMDQLAGLVRKINPNDYPFVYIREGYVQEIRKWAKTDEVEPGLQSVESMLSRYKDYQMQLRLEIERTAFVHAEYEYLNSLLTGPDSIFPIAIRIPQAIRKGTVSEKRVLKSKDDVLHEIAVLKKNGSDRFDDGPTNKFSNAAFLYARNREQAQLEQILNIAYLELKNLPLALKDEQKRERLKSELKDALFNEELRAPSEDRYVESRRQFTAELLYFTGKRDLDQKGANANDKLYLNDKSDLGIDSESLGPVSKMGRLIVATFPLQALGALLFSLAPMAQQQLKHVFAYETVLQEIAKQDDAKFETAAHAFMKKHSGATFKDGKWILNAKAQADVTRLQELHAEFKADAEKEKLSAASLQKILEGN